MDGRSSPRHLGHGRLRSRSKDTSRIMKTNFGLCGVSIEGEGEKRLHCLCYIRAALTASLGFLHSRGAFSGTPSFLTHSFGLVDDGGKSGMYSGPCSI